MIILLKHGLANRLRTMVGFLYVAEKLNKHVYFHWLSGDKECGGNWEEIFESVPFVRSCEKNKSLNYFFEGESTIHNIVDKYLCEEVKWNSKEEKDIENKYYKLFKIKANIFRKAKIFVDSLKKPYCAVHIRRTDHTELAQSVGQYTCFAVYEKFMKEHSKKDIYLATDDAAVQKRYPALKMYNKLEKSTSLRQSSLEHAFIDILIAAGADDFCGTGYSSYSNLIRIYHRLLKNELETII